MWQTTPSKALYCAALAGELVSLRRLAATVGCETHHLLLFSSLHDQFAQLVTGHGAYGHS
jgi:hypothetical protein